MFGSVVAGCPEIVCLCGSTRFKAMFELVAQRLTFDGAIVLSPGVFGHADQVFISPAVKAQLDLLHRHKIALADRVVVIDVGGYIGESTSAEIAYAKEIGRQVTFYSGGR